MGVPERLPSQRPLAPAPILRSSRPRLSGWSSLVTRILIVNLLALAALAIGILYLESFRSRLVEARAQELSAQGELLAFALARMPDGERLATVAAFSSPRGMRARLYAPDGRLVADNWADPAVPRFVLEDPTTAGFRRQSAIAIDRLLDLLAGQPEHPRLPQPSPAEASRSFWPEAEAAFLSRQPQTASRQNEDRLVVLQAAVPVGSVPLPDTLLLTIDTPDIVDLVRRERATSFIVFLIVLGLSLALSLFLARTIVVPLRQLALAAHRVRLGRARDVVVPRLPHRRDEIGSLARALADMTATLRSRMDATEAFAADVAHELKNPLASLRSAVEALSRVKAPAAREQLFGLIEEDVRRIDRLITDISAVSRLDAELSRTRLQSMDVGQLVSGLVRARTMAGPAPRGVRLVAAISEGGPFLAAVDPDRLGQVVNNLVDNALSFSPDGGLVAVTVSATPETLALRVEDEGPGIASEARDAVFERFYSERPEREHYGTHSGLGLSIARAIVEAMDGRIAVVDRVDGGAGAALLVSLPRLQAG